MNDCENCSDVFDTATKVNPLSQKLSYQKASQLMEFRGTLCYQIFSPFSLPLLLTSRLTSSLWWSCTTPESSRQYQTSVDSNHKALPAFTETTTAAGLGDFKYINGAFGKVWFPEQMGAGCGFIDCDNDGWLDILLVGGGTLIPHSIPEPPALWLYRNNGNGSFSLKTKEAGLDGIRAYGTGITVLCLMLKKILTG